MDSMEFLNVQFAIPIVGVVLCVFLVFAFGFRSVGQPSFEAIGEVEIKRRKGREVKKNSKTKVTNSTTIIEKSKNEPEKKSTVKKRSTENKPVKQLSVKKNVNEKPHKPVVEEEMTMKDGEWQTCLSKRRSRKLREESISNDSDKETQKSSTKKGKSAENMNRKKEERPQNSKQKSKPLKESVENLNATKSSNVKPTVRKEALKEVESNQPTKKVEEKLIINTSETSQGKNIATENSHSKETNGYSLPRWARAEYKLGDKAPFDRNFDINKPSEALVKFSLWQACFKSKCLRTETLLTEEYLCVSFNSNEGGSIILAQLCKVYKVKVGYASYIIVTAACLQLFGALFSYFAFGSITDFRETSIKSADESEI
ncbi:DgyrCDS5980 [Dimorphilus gyrociliatus]|uniref:DgyrCDS5980 n=1 Tax=Dimorphilus gyrociliatus TaxID=2664684 RepID=A0A7I8VN82_9ANNE|nr:DgyrCDS5980 [Dimorphilus gyrociliatus]